MRCINAKKEREIIENYSSLNFLISVVNINVARHVIDKIRHREYTENAAT